jgi:predicted nucleic-acid-binding Zn-ribbon protein
VTFPTCLRCGSPERYVVNADGDNGQIHLSGTLKSLSTDTYACGDCGYVERYVAQESMALLRQRAVRITPGR